MSKNTLVLNNPILINGKEVTELEYDPQEITAEQFSIACAKAAAMDKTQSFTFKFKENDHALHLYLGIMSVIAVNPGIDVKDLERLKGFDVVNMATIGMLFTCRRSAVPSEENNSAEQSANTENSTTAASSKSAE